MCQIYFSVVVIGGDGSVSQAINIMIELTIQRDKKFHINENSIDSIRDKLTTPLSIIAAGSTNLIANTLYGTTNYNTSLMHLFYGYLHFKFIYLLNIQYFVNFFNLHLFNFR